MLEAMRPLRDDSFSSMQKMYLKPNISANTALYQNAVMYFLDGGSW